MTLYFVFMGGAALFGTFFVVMDLINDRRRRRKGGRAHSARRTRSCHSQTA